MEITRTTTVDALLKNYPFILEALVAQSPLFEKLKSPVMRKTMGKLATLEKVASMGGLNVD